MSFFQQGRPSRKRSVYGHNTGTSTETVYTCPANCVAEVTFIHIHNSLNNPSIEVEWYVSEDDYTSHFLEGKNLGASEYLQFPDIELVLQPGDRIQITPSVAAHIDTILTVTETFIPVG